MPRVRPDDNNNVLREFREAVSLTQQKAADAVGVSRTTWSAWELRERPMSVAHLNRIKQVLKMDDSNTRVLREWWGDACHT